MYVSTPCVCRASSSQKWASDPLKLELQIVVSVRNMWVLGTETVFSGRAASTLKL